MKLYKQMLLFTFSLILTQVSCTRQNTKAANAGKSQQTDVPAKTVAMKTVTDNVGNVVEIPTNPQRIASLHTLSTTAMLWDLGAPLIGTATRAKGDEDNRPYIRGVEEVYGVKFQDLNLANYGAFGEDIEQIKASKPDLIVGTEYHLKNYKQFSIIAPTVIIEAGRPDPLPVFRDLAGWVGKSEQFNASYKKYQARLQQVKEKFSVAPEKQIIAYAHPFRGKAQYYACIHYGAFSRVAYDLGFKKLSFLEKQYKPTEACRKLSAETFVQMNSDWLLSTFRNQTGETVETIYAGFDDIAPGWREYNSAYKNEQMIVLSREMADPMTFKALDWILDQFVQVAK